MSEKAKIIAKKFEVTGKNLASNARKADTFNLQILPLIKFFISKRVS